MQRLARKLVLLGWDGADWKLLNPLLDAGAMPNLAALIERGTMGNLATLTPVLSPMLWTSIATGKTADRHGILGFLEPDPVTGGARPVASTSRQCKAVWNILNQSGLKPHVLGWFASHPAEPVDGVYVSSAFPKAVAPREKPWPLPPGSVHPARLEQTLAELRLHPGDLTAEDLLPFVPELARIDQNKDLRLVALARLLAENIGIHAAATWAMENEPWDLLAVYYDAIDHACHSFMPYHPPRMEQVSEEDFALYRHVVSGVYRFHDMMLGRMRQLAGDDATFLIVSDHGFHSDHLRPAGVAAFAPETPVLWHRQHGMICLAGPGIRHDELIYGAGLLDIAPTVLALFGLPAGADMPGRVLAEAFQQAPPCERIPSWEEVPGISGQHRKAPEQEAWDSSAAIQQLVDLGYIEAPPEHVQQQAHLAEMHAKFNLARVHLAAGRAREAAVLLEEVVRDTPNLTCQLYLAQAWFQAGELGACRGLIDQVVRQDSNRPFANLILGTLRVAEGQLAEGLQYLEGAESAERPMPAVRAMRGRVCLRMKRWGDAERAFRSVLELDAHSVGAHQGLASALLELGRLEEAADSALTAVGLEYNRAGAHYTLGAALARLGRTERAIQAFETCLALRPGTPEAHQWLATIHEQATGDRTRATEHRRLARELSA